MPRGTKRTKQQIVTDRITEIMRWAEQYSTSSARRILLNANDIPPELRREVAVQLDGIASLRQKVPTWQTRGCYIPHSLATEQCSGEATARFKASLIAPRQIVADLTGGLGVDLYFLCSQARSAIYVDRDDSLCEAARYNFRRLGMPPTEIIHGDLQHHWPSIMDGGATVLYTDPARRDKKDKNKRVFALADCEPVLPALVGEIRTYCHAKGCKLPTMLFKVSPMLDIKSVLQELSGISEIHILSHRNEVKELLLVLRPECISKTADEVPIIASDLHSDGTVKSQFAGTRKEDAASGIEYSAPKSYLHEPAASVMKSGLFRLLSAQFGILPLGANSHLFTSDEILEKPFPGKSFRLIRSYPYHSSIIKNLHREIPSAQITCRNFPLGAEALRQKLRIKESETSVLLATTLSTGQKVLLHCQKEITT